MQKQTLIVGAGGQVGTALARHLSQANGHSSALLSGRSPREGWLQLDLATLRDQAEVAHALIDRPVSAILCVAAFTYVDGCEDQPELAFQVNAHAPAALAGYARQQGIPFVYYSSDYVFDGSDAHPGPYSEDSKTHPINVYGASKLAGEEAVLRQHPDALILRTAGVYGPDEQGKNYLYTVLRLLATGQTLRVPMDQVSTPTYNADLASATVQLLARGASGIFHVCGPELMNRLELAQRIAAEFNLDPSPLEGLSTDQIGQRAARPLRSGLRSDKLHAYLSPAPMRSLHEALAACRPEMEQRLAAWRQPSVPA